MAVYFIRAGEDGPVKIGHATDVLARLADLQVAHHAELKLAREIPGGLAEEAWLHRRFCSLRIRGEWFRFSDEMLTIELPRPLTVPQRIGGNGRCLLLLRIHIVIHGISILH